ncbi:ABC transporter ATP-binding protein [Cellulosimicrobium sp. PMB13]|uniref:ABC transporter ATP-binding protein n=1 Tax=Cellulosimicrobium sp. PMB13 TaxID=3120158 RepID=UPI003F4BCF6E
MATHAGGLTGAPSGSVTAGPPGTAPGPTTAGPAVRVRSLVRSYGDKRILDDLDLTVDDGEFVAILGRSGSGKSTLLRALAALDHDVAGSGEVVVPDQVSVVFQDSRLLPWARVLDNVVLGLDGASRTTSRGRSRSTAREAGRESLAEVGLAGRERAWPNELSGGEQQRVSLARSLVRSPRLLLADEPFGALDALTRIRMHALLRDLCARHRPAVLLVTHDVDEAIVLADRVVVLDEGRIARERRVADSYRPGERRDAADPRFARIRTELLDALGVDRGADTKEHAA